MNISIYLCNYSIQYNFSNNSTPPSKTTSTTVQKHHLQQVLLYKNTTYNKYYYEYNTYYTTEYNIAFPHKNLSDLLCYDKKRWLALWKFSLLYRFKKPCLQSFIMLRFFKDIVSSPYLYQHFICLCTYNSTNWPSVFCIKETWITLL